MTIDLHISDLVGIAVGAGAFFLGRWLFVAGRRWLVRRLSARHERECMARNAIWRGRIVRHPMQGKVGLCIKVCVLRGDWRDHVLPRWTADVVVLAPLAGHIQRSTESMFDVIGKGIAIAAGLAKGDIVRIPLGELAVAPESDAAAFRREMEETLS